MRLQRKPCVFEKNLTFECGDDSFVGICTDPLEITKMLKLASITSIVFVSVDVTREILFTLELASSTILGDDEDCWCVRSNSDTD